MIHIDAFPEGKAAYLHIGLAIFLKEPASTKVTVGSKPGFIFYLCFYESFCSECHIVIDC